MFVREDAGKRWIETQNLTPGSPPARLTSLDGIARNPAWGPAAGEVPPPPPTVSIDDASAAEGDPLDFALTLSRAAEHGRDRHGRHDDRHGGRRGLHVAQRSR